MTAPSAAAKLEGMKLANSWEVIRAITRPPSSTGGHFSHSYEVRNGDKTGFLKAFDFSDAFSTGGDIIAKLSNLVASFKHERDILDLCKSKRMSKVVVALDHGSVSVAGFSGPEAQVFYLIFEMADGDVRCQVDSHARLDSLWCLRALRDTCLGLMQLHTQMIAHQDIKPSNVLVYRQTSDCKIADFGRSI